MVGTSRNLDRRLLCREVTDIRPLAGDYRALFRRGADVIETDIPVELGALVKEWFPAPKARARPARP